MGVYSARGFTAATAATADHTIAALWNPDSLKRIMVLELGIFKAGAGTANDSIYVCRTTTQGTAGTSLTADAENAWAGDDTTSSGAILGLAAYSAQPTKATTPFLWGWVAAAVAASGVIWPTPRGLWVPPASGIAIVQRAATIWPTSEVYFTWEE